MALLTVSVIAVSCQKELSALRNNPSDKNIWAAWEAKQPAPQKFTVNASTQNSFSGQKGTRVMLPANAFVTASGGPVSGNVTIEFKEIYEVWEMVLNNKFTQVGTTPIESGGQFYIRATQGGAELKLAPGKTVLAALPADTAMPNMQVFTGSRFDSAGQSNFSWQLAADPATNNVAIRADSAGMQDYLMQFGMLGWINCDRFLNEPLHDVQVKIANALPNEQIGVVVHLDGMKSVMQLWSNGTVYKGKVPERGVTFIALSNRNGQAYAAFQSAQVQAGQQYTLTMAPSTDEAFGQKLKTLN